MHPCINVPLAPIFLKRTLVFPFQLFSFISLLVHLRVSNLSLLFSGTLHSVECMFPFLPCLSLLFLPQLFVKPLQITTLPSCISFSLGWFWSLPLYSVTKFHPNFFRHSSTRSNLQIYSSPPVYNYTTYITVKLLLLLSRFSCVQLCATP